MTLKREEDGRNLQMSLRLPADLLDRADALVRPVAQDPAYRMVRITRQAILRFAIERGIAELEAEYAAQLAEGR